MFSLLAFVHLFSFTVSFVIRIHFFFHCFFLCYTYIYIFFFTYLVQFVYCAMKLFRVCYVLYYILRKCAQIHDEDFF